MSRFRSDLNMVVLKGSSFSQSGLVCTISWAALQEALRRAAWLKSTESIEKIRFGPNGLDIFIDGPISPSNELREVK